MNARVVILAGVILLGLWATRERRAAHGPAPAGRTPAMWPPGSATRAFESCPYCGPHVHAARQAAGRFEHALVTTPSGGDHAAAVRALFRHRAQAMAEMHEVRMRLPNDLDAERRWATLTDEMDARMLAHIEDARRRGGAALVHPGPVDDAWFGQWYRASNDVVL